MKPFKTNLTFWLYFLQNVSKQKKNKKNKKKNLGLFYDGILKIYNAHVYPIFPSAHLL